jgi:hypothetical protein
VVKSSMVPANRVVASSWNEGATVRFPCGVGCVASRLLSKLVGLYHKVVYVGGLWEVHDRLPLADALIHMQSGFLL